MSSVWQWLQGTATSAADIVGGIFREREQGRTEREVARANAAAKAQAEVTKQRMYVALGATAIGLLGLLIILRKKG